MLSVQSISKSFGIQTILSDVSFTLNTGERLGLVVPNGNRYLHAVGDGGVTVEDGGHRFQAISLDAPLVAPGRPSLLDFNNDLPNLQHGMHFNLYNNVWGTNFPMWFGEDCRFRFMNRTQLESKSR